MRTTIWLVSIALLGGGAACKKSSTEKSATELRKAQENVDDQKKDLDKKTGDMVDETKDVAKAGDKVSKQAADVASAEARLADARIKLQANVNARLLEIDAKLAALDSQGDGLSKQLATDLKAKREIVAKLVGAADSTAIVNWDSFKSEVDDNLTMLANDTEKALGTDKDRDKILDHKLKLDADRSKRDEVMPKTRQ